MNKISTESYKGVRDFYPQDEFIQRYIKDTWIEVAERYGYEAYDASILEPLELYLSKTSDEIVNEQTYNFRDRGNREVVLRPEMTPTVARMVAGRARDLGFPLRLFSIPNVFRYERPQRGRLREHWQLNCDLFGLSTQEAEIEMIVLMVRTLEAFGLAQDQFEVRISDRILLQKYLKEHDLNEEEQKAAIRLIDRWDKDKEAQNKLAEMIGTDFDLQPDENLKELIEKLAELGVNNVVFDKTLARGFDYYTGVVFEAFDKNPNNNRSICGGGRYDRLLETFGQDSIPTVGFGLGDVVMRDLLETYDLLPEYQTAADLCLISLESTENLFTLKLAEALRAQGLNTETDTTNRKTATAIKHALKREIPFIAVIGQDEIKTQTIKLKHLPTGQELSTDIKNISDQIQNFLFNLD